MPERLQALQRSLERPAAAAHVPDHANPQTHLAFRSWPAIADFGVRGSAAGCGFLYQFPSQRPSCRHFGDSVLDCLAGLH